jgi:NNP family nitrate/nitrite transporter-like MFS transporter
MRDIIMQTPRANVTLGMATAAFAVSFIAWSLLAPLAPQLQRQYHLNDFAISLVIAVPVILGSLARMPMGVLADRFGGRRVMTALLAFCIIPLLGMTTASSLPAFLLWGLILGMAGSSFAVGVPFVSRSFTPVKQGLVLGVFGMGNIGTAIAARFAPLIAKTHGWQAPFYLTAGLVALMAVAFYFLAGDEPRAETALTLGQRLTVLKQNRLSWLFSLFYFVTFGAFVSFGLYLPKLLVDNYGLDRLDAGNRAAGFVVMATLARPLGGWFADRVGGANILAVVFIAAPALALVLAFAPGMVILTLCFLALAALLGLGNGAVFKLVPQFFAKDAGTVTGLVGAAGGLGGFFPPLVLGIVKSSLGSYSLGYVLLSAVALVCFALTLVVLHPPLFGPRQSRQRVSTAR